MFYGILVCLLVVMRKVNTMKIHLILILFLFPIIANAELSEFQKQVLNEPVTMIDLFIDRSEKTLNEYFEDKELELWTTNEKEYDKIYTESLNQKEGFYGFLKIPVKTKGNTNIKLPFSIEVLLNFDKGLWEIHAWVKGERYFQDGTIYPTSQNAQSLCKTMLSRMKNAHLSFLNARHSGYSRKGYLNKGVYDRIGDNTIHSVVISTSWRERRMVECQRKQQEPLKNTVIKLTGDWK